MGIDAEFVCHHITDAMAVLALDGVHAVYPPAGEPGADRTLSSAGHWKIASCWRYVSAGYYGTRGPKMANLIRELMKHTHDLSYGGDNEEVYVTVTPDVIAWLDAKCPGPIPGPTWWPADARAR